ncbi:hypothetical protein J6590_062273 [Homalodisca vitripennis]|nr:hypothetical protein J6590_062273 [Homalodisca vitripennis]
MELMRNLYLRDPKTIRSNMLDFGPVLEIATLEILSVTVSLFISTIQIVLKRLSPLFSLSAHSLKKLIKTGPVVGLIFAISRSRAGPGTGFMPDATNIDHYS